ncbi:hypothetical protein H0H93_013455, partial [Arthromyces matolae]
MDDLRRKDTVVDDWKIIGDEWPLALDYAMGICEQESWEMGRVTRWMKTKVPARSIYCEQIEYTLEYGVDWFRMADRKDAYKPSRFYVHERVYPNDRVMYLVIDRHLRSAEYLDGRFARREGSDLRRWYTTRVLRDRERQEIMDYDLFDDDIGLCLDRLENDWRRAPNDGSTSVEIDALIDCIVCGLAGCHVAQECEECLWPFNGVRVESSSSDESYIVDMDTCAIRPLEGKENRIPSNLKGKGKAKESQRKSFEIIDGNELERNASWPRDPSRNIPDP